MSALIDLVSSFFVSNHCQACCLDGEENYCKKLKRQTLPDHKIVERSAPRLLLLNDQAFVAVGRGLADGSRDLVWSGETENSWNLFRYGFKVGQFPWWFAAGCLLFTGLCGIGLINYTTENNAFRLWIAKDSQFVKNYEFLVQNYPQDVRFNNVILSSQTEGQNVLNGESLALLQRILEGVAQEIVVANDTKRWEQLCKK